MDTLGFASIQEMRFLLQRKEISPRELLESCLRRFQEHDEKICSALEIFDAESICAASNATQTGDGILYGIPGIIKDNICNKGRIASCASKILASYRSPYNATAVERLHGAGAYIVGRANCDEFAMGSSTEYSAYQKTKNPWNVERVSGGSSGGSIAAVASGFVPWALGSETGGSVRQPAAFCGVVGSKPTYGLVSRYGLVAYASSLDQIGVATRTVYDNALVLSAIAGHDPRDGTSLSVEKFDFTRDLTGKLEQGLKIGVIENAMHADGMDPEISEALEQALKQLEKLGAQIKRIMLPTMDYSAAVYFVVSRAEAASNLARFDGVRYGVRSKSAHSLDEVYAYSRTEGFGPEVQLRILLGNYVLSVGHADEYYKSAKKVQKIMRDDVMRAFGEVDLLFSPVSGCEAFKFGACSDNALQLDLQDYFTCPANLVGMPAVAVPCGFTRNKLPMGFQLVGPDLSEGLIFQTLYAYEQSTPWHTMRPSL